MRFPHGEQVARRSRRERRQETRARQHLGRNLGELTPQRSVNKSARWCATRRRRRERGQARPRASQVACSRPRNRLASAQQNLRASFRRGTESKSGAINVEKFKLAKLWTLLGKCFQKIHRVRSPAPRWNEVREHYWSLERVTTCPVLTL